MIKTAAVATGSVGAVVLALGLVLVVLQALWGGDRLFFSRRPNLKHRRSDAQETMVEEVRLPGYVLACCGSKGD
jgi:hypothetical protein